MVRLTCRILLFHFDAQIDDSNQKHDPRSNPVVEIEGCSSNNNRNAEQNIELVGPPVANDVIDTCKGLFETLRFLPLLFVLQQ